MEPSLDYLEGFTNETSISDRRCYAAGRGAYQSEQGVSSNGRETCWKGDEARSLPLCGVDEGL
jgi:hypothetical protein